MISVAGRTVTDDLGIDVCTSCLCVFVFFKNYDTASIAENEAASLCVKRNACSVNIGRLCYSVHIVEACISKAYRALLRTARYRNVHIAVLYSMECLAYSVCTAGAGRYRTVVYALEACTDSNRTCRHIAYHLRDSEYGNSLVALVVICEKLLLRCFHTADTRPDYNAASVRIEILEIASCVLYSLIGRIHGILCDDICAAQFLLVEKSLCAEILYRSLYIKLFALTGKPLLECEAVLTLHKTVPEFFLGVSYRAYYTHTGNYNSAHFLYFLSWLVFTLISRRLSLLPDLLHSLRPLKRGMIQHLLSPRLHRICP